jgi:NADH dehydrogenase
VAHVRGYGFTGFPAWLAWRIMLLMFVPAWERKVRMLLDWIVSPLVGRDIVKMNVDPPYDIRRELFEVGQDIVRQGDVGRRLYLVWSGEVDVIRNGPTGSETIATLSRGQHFGEVAVFQDARRTATVRARTRVEVFSIGQQEAIALTRVTDRLAHLRDLPEGTQPSNRDG